MAYIAVEFGADVIVIESLYRECDGRKSHADDFSQPLICSRDGDHCRHPK